MHGGTSLEDNASGGERHNAMSRVLPVTARALHVRGDPRVPDLSGVPRLILLPPYPRWTDRGESLLLRVRALLR